MFFRSDIRHLTHNFYFWHTLAYLTQVETNQERHKYEKGMHDQKNIEIMKFLYMASYFFKHGRKVALQFFGGLFKVKS